MFERSKIKVSRDRFTCKDFDNTLIHKSPTSLPDMSKSFNLVNSPISLIKSLRPDLNRQSISHSCSRLFVFEISHFIKDCIKRVTTLLNLWKLFNRKIFDDLICFTLLLSIESFDSKKDFWCLIGAFEILKYRCFCY